MSVIKTNKRPSPKIGMRFGMLKITGIAGKDKWRATIVNTRCACGNDHSTLFKLLLRGDTKSCGCLAREMRKSLHLTHGKTGTKAYFCYRNMLNRCYYKKSKSYKDYGKRGISVCNRWRDSFENFLEDMGEPPEAMTLERINNDIGYSKENCTWATRFDQIKNRRNSKKLTHDGKTMSVMDWAKQFGLKYRTLSARIFEYNWDIKTALTKPTRQW
jgi:hypothetical protein